MRRFLLGLTMLLLAAGHLPAVVPVAASLRGPLLGLFGPSAASAQDAADARTRARAAYTEGQRLFEAGDFPGALAKFEEAYAIVSNPVVLLGVASAQERLGRLPEARATLERYLRERADAPDRADVERRIAALPAPAPAPAAEEAAPPVAAAEPPPGTVSVTSEPAGALLMVDGMPADRTTPAELRLAPGEHTIGFGAPGFEPATVTVSVSTGGAHAVNAALTALPAAEDAAADEDAAEDAAEEDAAETEETPSDVPPAETEPSAATWILTAVAGASLVTGTVFGFLALSRQSDFDVLPTRSLADEGEAFALAADLAFGVATAAGITAIVLYAIDRPAAPAAEAATESEATESETTEGETTEGEASASLDLRVMPVVGPTTFGAAMSVNF
jgi:hypothetical protein